MNDEEMKQRIKYLVEHGGIAEDPIGDIRKHLRTLYVMVALALACHFLEAAIIFI